MDGTQGWFGTQACSSPATTSRATTPAWAPLLAFRSQAEHLGLTAGMCWSSVHGAWTDKCVASGRKPLESALALLGVPLEWLDCLWHALASMAPFGLSVTLLMPVYNVAWACCPEQELTSDS